MPRTDPAGDVEQAALAAHYIERVNAAVAVERLDIVADLAADYLVELEGRTAA